MSVALLYEPTGVSGFYFVTKMLIKNTCFRHSVMYLIKQYLSKSGDLLYIFHKLRRNKH